MFGVILLTQPSLIFPSLLQSEDEAVSESSEAYYSASDYLNGITLSLVSSFLGSFAVVTCRQIGTSVHESVHPFYFGIVTGIGGGLVVALSGSGIKSLTSFDLALLSICGIFCWI
jgi:drug/metabolite transporter (DMT)-like permease